MSELVALPETALTSRVTTTPTSLRVVDRDASLSMAEWSEVGRQLGRVGNSAMWWIGDWLRIGERTYGSTYTEAQRITGYEYESLRKASWVAASVETGTRVPDLSWGHHRAVAALAPAAQREWLARALAEGWSERHLLNMIRGGRALPDPRMDVRFHLAVPPERAERWKAAAEVAGVEFVEWAADVLDRAAA